MFDCITLVMRLQYPVPGFRIRHHLLLRVIPTGLDFLSIFQGAHYSDIELIHKEMQVTQKTTACYMHSWHLGQRRREWYHLRVWFSESWEIGATLFFLNIKAKLHWQHSCFILKCPVWSPYLVIVLYYYIPLPFQTEKVLTFSSSQFLALICPLYFLCLWDVTVLY